MWLTAFQIKVYEVVKRIPAGETRTYKWVARIAGRPRAYRAVGNMLARNTMPDVVPCHRVIRSDGSLGGYKWGVRRKARLLAAERRICYNKKSSIVPHLSSIVTKEETQCLKN